MLVTRAAEPIRVVPGKITAGHPTEYFITRQSVVCILCRVWRIDILYSVQYRQYSIELSLSIPVGV